MSDRITSLPTNQVQPNPFQPRGKIASEEIQELVESIRTYGILEPLVIAETPAGYQIIAGERRWRAARELEMVEVPVVIIKTTPRGMLEMAIVENVQRVDLSAIERAQAFQQLISVFGYTISQVAEKVSKSLPYVSNSLRLLDLPDAIKDGLVGNQITEGHARALASLDNERDQIEIYKIILKENGTVRRAEELVRRKKQQTEVKAQAIHHGKPEEDAVFEDHIDEWTSQLTEVFEPVVTKAKVKLARSSRQTKVTMTFIGSPTETQAALEKVLSLAKK